jgi:hypothetical protein
MRGDPRGLGEEGEAIRPGARDIDENAIISMG